MTEIASGWAKDAITLIRGGERIISGNLSDVSRFFGAVAAIITTATAGRDADALASLPSCCQGVAPAGQHKQSVPDLMRVLAS